MALPSNEMRKAIGPRAGHNMHDRGSGRFIPGTGEISQVFCGAAVIFRGMALAFSCCPPLSESFRKETKPVPAGFECLEIVQRASRLIPRSRLLSGMVGFDGRLMKNFSISAAILFTATLGVCAASAQAQGDKPTVVRLDPALDALVSSDAKLQLVKGGFGFTEGIIWVEQGRYLLLSDIPANVIYKLTPKGEVSIYMHRSGYTKPDIWRVGFEQTNGKDPGDPLFEKFYMTGSRRTASAPSSPTASKAGNSTARTTSSSSGTARSTSPTPTAACACARKTRARAWTSRAST